MHKKRQIAFIHRYGLEGWICCGGHAVPKIIQNMSEEVDVHFYGPKTSEKHDLELRSSLMMHELPHRFNRSNPNDKFTKTILWYLWLPFIGIRCRLNGTQLIWNDETVPLTAPILQLFFGKNIAITVMDFFARIYTENHPKLHGLRNWVELIDFAAWKKVPLLFTKVLYTQDFLEQQGIPRATMHLYRNPVDHTKFHPVDDATRIETRKQLGFSDEDIILSHHGILHPNKGNDWILRRLKELETELPNLKYLLIGNGPEMDSLQQLALELDISQRIVFTGWLPTETDLNNALAAADIGLVMRIGQETDHFHMTDTLAHEMACAKPIIAVNLKGISEIIKEGENGFLVSPENPAQFNGQLKKVVENSCLREKFSTQIHQLSQEVSNIQISAISVVDSLRKQIKLSTKPLK